MSIRTCLFLLAMTLFPLVVGAEESKPSADEEAQARADAQAMLDRLKAKSATRSDAWLKVPCNPPQGQSNDGAQGLNRVYDWSVLMLRQKNLPAGEHPLEIALREWDAPACRGNDGRYLLSALDNALTETIRRQADWQAGKIVVQELRTKYPQAAFAALLEARFWTDYAWHARGSGYANTVSEEGWALFGERLTKAEALLNEAKPYAAQYPIWYESMALVQKGLSRPWPERQRLLDEGMKRFPGYFPLYFKVVDNLLPKWGGNWAAVEAFATWAATNDSTRGKGLYTRVYWWVQQTLERNGNIFKDTRARWPEMKSGFEDLMRAYPDSMRNLNAFAWFACLAKDQTEYAALRKRIGDKLYADAWGGAAKVELCDFEMAARQKL